MLDMSGLPFAGKIRVIVILHPGPDVELLCLSSSPHSTLKVSRDCRAARRIHWYSRQKTSLLESEDWRCRRQEHDAMFLFVAGFLELRRHSALPKYLLPPLLEVFASFLTQPIHGGLEHGPEPR